MIFRLLFGERSFGDLSRGERRTTSEDNSEFILEQNEWFRKQNEEVNVRMLVDGKRERSEKVKASCREGNGRL